MKWTRVDRAHAIVEARRAREQAEQQLAAVRRRWPHVTALATDLRRIRQANHFAEMIQKAFEG